MYPERDSKLPKNSRREFDSRPGQVLTRVFARWRCGHNSNSQTGQVLFVGRVNKQLKKEEEIWWKERKMTDLKCQIFLYFSGSYFLTAIRNVFPFVSNIGFTVWEEKKNVKNEKKLFLFFCS